LSQQQISNVRPPKRKQNNKRLIKNISSIAVVVLVFFAGINVGNGRISFGEGALYHKPIQKNQSSSNQLDYNGVEEIYSSLKQGFDGQIDNNKLEDGLKAGLVKAAGDPFTEYLNAEETKAFNEQLSGSFEGIGAELTKEDSAIVIVSPIAGFPAEKAGLKAHDAISKINDENAYDISITEAVKKIRGPKGTKVKIQIVRGGKPIDFEITRDQITIPSVTHEIVDGNIGVIKITRFGEDTAALTRTAARELKDKGVKGVVLDMRGNPGGLLDAAVDVSSVWLSKGKTVLEEKRDGKVVKSFPAKGGAILDGMPTVVLIDGGSASASEITAGALQDNKAATLIGVKSFGKGSVQEVRDLSSGGVLKVTIAHWFTPSGRSIDKQGIEPEQKIDLTDADTTAKKDPQKDAAIAKLKQ
jgi:carboxyl-terminal processing protease